MKTCPTCQTPVFDDMPRCFSCLFDFEDASKINASNLDESFLSVDKPPSLALACKTADKIKENEAARKNAKADAETTPAPTLQVASANASPKTSARIPAGEWLLRLEIRSTENPGQVWSMELSPTNWSAAIA